jgi:RimJ/RimL family protein N-acetyltransferase
MMYLNQRKQTHFNYLPYGPFKTIEDFKHFIHLKELPSNDTFLYSILVNNTAVGFIIFARVNQEYGTVEIGHVNFSEQLLQTRQATEANYLLLQYAFDILGYKSRMEK